MSRVAVELSPAEWEAALVALESAVLEGRFSDERAARKACEAMASQLAMAVPYRAWQHHRDAAVVTPAPTAPCPECARRVNVIAIRHGSGVLRLHKARVDAEDLCPGTLSRVRVAAVDGRALAAGAP
jgi:hypothetical protein